MKTLRNIKITIKQVRNRSGEYIAYFTSDFLGGGCTRLANHLERRLSEEFYLLLRK